MTTRLGADVTATQTTWSVDNDDILGTLNYPIRLVIESETIEVVGAAFPTMTDTERKVWTVRRGVDGTAPAAHTGGVAITSGAVTTGSDAAELAAHEADTTNVHGIADTSTAGLVRRQITVLTHAQILTLPTTFIEVIPAPGVDKTIQFIGATLKAVNVANYTNIDVWASPFTGIMGITTPIDDNLIVSEVMKTSLLLAGGAARRYSLGHRVDDVADGVARGLPSPQVNAGGFLFAYNSGNFTGGDVGNSLTVTAFYIVVDL